MSNFIDKLKSNWATITLVITMITTAIGTYNKIESYIEKKSDEAIARHIKAHKKKVDAERDSIISNINKSYFIPLGEKVDKHDFFLDQVIQGLHAEFDPFEYRGYILYKSNPNDVGYVQTWYLFERNHRWEIYTCKYNATQDCYEYYDIIEKKKKYLKK